MQSITCHAASEGGATQNRSDELIVVVQPDALLPMSLPGGLHQSYTMAAGASWTIGRTFHFDRDLLITLYEHDESMTRKRSDYLVSQVYTPDNLPASVRLSNRNGADYTIQVSIA